MSYQFVIRRITYIGFKKTEYEILVQGTSDKLSLLKAMRDTVKSEYPASVIELVVNVYGQQIIY